MLTMSKEPLKISWDELTTEKVEAKLQRLDAVARAKEQFDKPTAPSPIAAKSSALSFLYNTLVYMTLFGAAGGIFGWAFGEIMNFRPDYRQQAAERINQYNHVLQQKQSGEISAKVADPILREIGRSSRSNEYVAVYVDNSLTQDQKDAKTAEIAERDRWKDFIATVLFFGISGMMISTFLSSAESIVSRNTRARR